jgi:hypothetical protein
MTVGELIRQLRNFPPELPVFLNTGGLPVFVSREAKMDLVDLGSMQRLPDDARSAAAFVDSVVVSSEKSDQEGLIWTG